jgi:uncharacterized protein YegL
MSKKKTTKVTTEVTIEDYKNEKTQIICILDRSGSMNNIIGDAIGGFNSFIKEQKEMDTPTTMTVALFDDQYELLYDNVDLKEIKEITSKEWSPRGMTALNDAIGKTINSVRAEHKKLKKKEKPEKVLVCIVTDGLENASLEYTNESIKKLTQKSEKKNWSFVYLAANQDAFEEGTSRGFSGGNTLNYANTSTGNAKMFSAMSSMTSNIRGASVSSANYADMSKNLAKDLEKDIDK